MSDSAWTPTANSFLDDLLGQDEPTVVVSGDLRVVRRYRSAQGVVAGQIRAGSRRPNASNHIDDGRAESGSHGRARSIPVLHTFGVVPHAVPVNPTGAAVGGDVEYPPIDAYLGTR